MVSNKSNLAEKNYIWLYTATKPNKVAPVTKLVPGKEEILNDLLKALVEGRNIAEISKILFAHLREVMPLERLGIAIIDDERKFLVSKVNVSEHPVLLQDGHKSRISHSTLQSLLDGGQTRIINDLNKYLAEKPESVSTRLMVQEGVRSNMSVPLIANGHAMGILFLGANYEGAYGQGHVEIVNHLSRILSLTLEKALLLENLQRKQSTLVETMAEKEGLRHRLTMGNDGSGDWNRTWREWEIFIITNVMLKCRGRIYGPGGAAELLKLAPTTLQGKMKKLGLKRREILSHQGEEAEA